MRTLLAPLAFAAALSATAATAQEATYTATLLTPETALKGARAALAACRDAGYQVAVAVVDRSGVAQVILRDRFAGVHTPDTAKGKAWTAVSFRSDTRGMAKLIQDGGVPAGIGNLPGVVAVGGGLTIEAGGAMVGGIGVSGAPAGELDEKCAQAGVDAIAEETF